MLKLSIAQTSATSTGDQILDSHFGANALHSVNTGDGPDYAPSQGFVDAVDQLKINHLRYPGGHVENTIDITKLDNGELRSEVVTFLDWVLDTQAETGQKQEVTIVLPTKTDIPASTIAAFTTKLLEKYGELITGFEIGNEYSIGRYQDGYDRSEHPEEDAGSSFVSSQGEADYAIAANTVIRGVQNAVSQLNAGGADLDPKILIQMAETNGAGSNYKNGGDFTGANREILDFLSSSSKAAIDGVIVHYYYNQTHKEDMSLDNDWTEVRRIDQRYEDFVEQFGRDVPMYITEWNVLNGNEHQSGMASASVLLEMFEFMVRTDVTEAFIWPLQHRTANNIMGNRNADDVDQSISGAAFQMMSEALRPKDSVTGVNDTFESMSGSWSGVGGDLEINQYSSQYSDVLYISSRSLQRSEVDIDLGRFMNGAHAVEVSHLTMDRTTSDGLSDQADENGLNRVGRRVIDQEEYRKLSDLPFFDENNKNHIRIDGNGNYTTYLPSYEGIIALVDNPRTMDDYYFATESDVKPLVKTYQATLNRAVQVNLMPYDVVQITVSHSWEQTGSAGHDQLKGGLGVDVIQGGAGNDNIQSGEANDTLDGGSGDDTLLAGAGDDLLTGGLGNDMLYGGDGIDRVVINASSTETRFGGSDGRGVTLISTDGTDVLSGVEFVAFTDRVMSVDALSSLTQGEVNLPQAPNIVRGTVADDTLSVLDRAVSLYGGAGQDKLTTGASDDRLFGEDGHDILSAGLGNDTLDGGSGHDVLMGLGGNDSLTGGEGNDTLKGGRDNDVLDGGLGNDSIVGQRNGDTLTGGAGDDTLKGGGGNDQLFGGDGNDFLRGGTYADLLKGQQGDDTLIGNRHDDTLNGGWGNDVLNAGGDDDLLIGGGGNDVMKGGSGQDVFVFDSNFGNDVIEDFSFADDVLRIQGDLGQGLSASQVVDLATVQSNGVMIAFDGGDSILLEGVTTLTGLEAAIEIL
jgi:Ca2+-binding RTX toxin-like protein